jgi:hypothetical protein
MVHSTFKVRRVGWLHHPARRHLPGSAGRGSVRPSFSSA